MDYKETVMSEVVIEELAKNSQGTSYFNTKQNIKEAAERQAEITWPIAEKAGIKKMQDFIEKEFGYFIDKRLCKIIIDDGGYYGQEGSIAKYQAFLKEIEK